MVFLIVNLDVTWRFCHGVSDGLFDCEVLVSHGAFVLLCQMMMLVVSPDLMSCGGFVLLCQMMLIVKS